MIWWKKAIIAGIIFIGCIFIFNSLLMPWYVGHNTLVKVPSVVGLSFGDANKVLDEADLEGVQGDIRYDVSKPLGTVLDQNPTAQQMVKDGRRIYLVVSGGEQLYDVPNLVGRTVRESKFILAQRNLELQEVGNKPSVQYPAGIIMTQIETVGAKVKKGARIGVVVSAGVEAGDLRVPDLIGKNVEEAKKLILQNKLSIGKINFQPSTTVAVNAVIDQYPKANSLASENTRIDLFVNRVEKKKIETEQEMNSMEEVKSDEETKKDVEKAKEQDKDKKEEVKKKDEPKKDEPKKDDKKTDIKKDDKKKTDKPKDKDNDKSDDGTKF
ncbi:MAG: PASTA domain-containing protein [Ignavibacteria bacterium]|jgi:beta-lactam-binding protein with PASTA domain